jgi:uncharacterized protein (TIGR02246 family)
MAYSNRLGLAALMLWSAACQPAPRPETASMGATSEAAPAKLSAEDEAAIRELGAKWDRAFAAGDGKAIGALYTDDAVLLPANEPMVKGEAARKYWADATNDVSGRIELNTTSVEGSGNVAYTVGTYRSTLTPKKAGAKPLPVEEGKWVNGLKKQDDGSWKIAVDAWNSNAPAKPMK